jgi:hypothetical protein
MFAAFGFTHVNYLRTVPFDDDPRLQRMPFFSLVILFLALFRAVYRTFRNINHDIPD